MSDSTFPWHKLTPLEVSRELTEGLLLFTQSYAEQFSLRIPPGILPRIDVLRDTYVPYLKDSEYKSNICYLLHLIQYQLWNYKIFRPKLSLENAFFYQQLITLGIVAEALAHAILLNPCIEPDPKDRSRGKVAANYLPLHKEISQRNFAQNIDLLASLKVIDLNTRKEYHEIRSEMRNVVHIQNWNDRLYQSLTYEHFTAKLKSFMNFMTSLKKNINLQFSPSDLENALHKEQKIYYGTILSYYSDKGYGFIASYDFPDNIFFHIKEFVSQEIPQVGSEVEFQVKMGNKGMLAIKVRYIK